MPPSAKLFMSELIAWYIFDIGWFIMQSTFIQAIITALNVCVLLFVIIAGGYIGFKTGWVGYTVSGG